jgi:hypothetical protein
MCRRVDCPTCGKPTFVGCGAHVEQVLGDVPAAQRCRCREERAEKTGERPGDGERAAIPAQVERAR